MQEKLQIIFKDQMQNLGNYDELGLNLWTNDFLSKKKKYLTKHDLPLGQSLAVSDGNSFLNFENLFSDNLSKLTFYKNAKTDQTKGGFMLCIDEDQSSKQLHRQFTDDCLNMKQLAVPVFARIYNNCLLLT